MSAGERAFFVTKQFRLQQVLVDRRAVDRLKHLLCPRRLIMNRARNKLFPVPDSPRISTVEFERATFKIILLTASIFGEAEMISMSIASRRSRARLMVASKLFIVRLLKIIEGARAARLPLPIRSSHARSAGSR